MPQASTLMGFPKVCAPRVITQMQWSVAQADMPPMEDVDDPEPRTEASHSHACPRMSHLYSTQVVYGACLWSDQALWGRCVGDTGFYG